MQEFEIIVGGNNHISRLSVGKDCAKSKLEFCYDTKVPTLIMYCRLQDQRRQKLFTSFVLPHLWFYNIGVVHVRAPSWEREISIQIKCETSADLKSLTIAVMSAWKDETAWS